MSVIILRVPIFRILLYLLGNKNYFLLVLVEALGYKREDILTFCDKENNMPLHCAVNSGDLVVCLSMGTPTCF